MEDDVIRWYSTYRQTSYKTSYSTSEFSFDIACFALFVLLDYKIQREKVTLMYIYLSILGLIYDLICVRFFNDVYIVLNIILKRGPPKLLIFFVVCRRLLVMITN